MIEYGTHSIEKILILRVIREAYFECFFDGIDELLEIYLIFVQLIDIVLDHEDYLIDDVHDQLEVARGQFGIVEVVEDSEHCFHVDFVDPQSQQRDDLSDETILL